MGNKHQGNDVRKTIRFDEDMCNDIDIFAKLYGMSFSSVVKMLLTDVLGTGEEDKYKAKISNSDRELLNEIRTLLLHSSNNLNQAAHALNSMKGYSFLHVNPTQLDSRLFQIESELGEVNLNFDSYGEILDKFIKHVRKRIK